MTIPQALYPVFAPLPVPFIEHIVKHFQEQTPLASQAWGAFEEEIREKRWSAFSYMHPFIQLHLAGSAKGSKDRYSTAWFLQTLSAHTPDKKPVVKQTLSLWTERGIYRSREHGLPDFDNAAALLIARMIDKSRLRGWQPRLMDSHEPDWWCWMQPTPEDAPVPCPVPLPQDLPAGALLWTPWSGAAWDPAWLLIEARRGAIRFASTIRSRVDGRRRWNIAEEDLLQWYPRLAPLAIDLHDPDLTFTEAQNMKHTLATHALQCLARTRLAKLF
jgi:hypothetical protein